MPFEFERSDLPEVMIIKPRRFGDDRGFFLETYKATDFTDAGIPDAFVQDNHSKSTRGVLRGIHYQQDPFAQGKLVRVVTGAVWDVAVDLRRSSRTFARWVGLELSADSGTMLWIPPGFGHGFLTLADETHFVYKCTAEYAPDCDAGIRYDDPDINIAWPEIGSDYLVSEKDRNLPTLDRAEVFS